MKESAFSFVENKQQIRIDIETFVYLPEETPIDKKREVARKISDKYGVELEIVWIFSKSERFDFSDLVGFWIILGLDRTIRRIDPYLRAIEKYNLRPKRARRLRSWMSAGLKTKIKKIKEYYAKAKSIDVEKIEISLG